MSEFHKNVNANAVSDRPAIEAARKYAAASQFARHEPVDANRGVRDIPGPDNRDPKNEKPA